MCGGKNKNKKAGEANIIKSDLTLCLFWYDLLNGNNCHHVYLYLYETFTNESSVHIYFWYEFGHFGISISQMISDIL